MNCETCNSIFETLPFEKAFFQKMEVPPSKMCPDCRQRRRLAFWPFGKFNRRTCDLTGEKLISIYPQNARFPVYKASEWHSDKWEAPALQLYLERPFFDQLYELQSKTPRPHQFGSQITSCDYSDDGWNSKNCYLCRSFTESENVSYSYRFVRCRDSYDICYCYDAEQSYDCTFCFKVYRVRYSFDVRDSYDSAFLYDCRNVSKCFMCWNLRGKDYCILNRQFTKEQYGEEMKKYTLGSYAEVGRISQEFLKHVREDTIHKTDFNVKCVNSTGNYLTECKNLQESYFFERSEDCVHVFRGLDQKSSCDSTGLWNGELVLNSVQLNGGYHLLHCNYSANCTDSEYLDFCEDCHNCFGCVGLKKKEFCILNTKYGEEEYKSLTGKIKEKMIAEGVHGQFFPYSMATTGYNLSLAQIYFPEEKQGVEKLGASYEELEVSPRGIEPYIPPDDVKGVHDEIIQKAIKCEESGRFFNITRDELEFLRIHQIPIPRKYPDVRTIQRFRRLPALHPREIKCFSCDKSIVSYYPEEWGYKRIACESCYQEKVL